MRDRGLREHRKQIAQETLRILKQGYYTTPSGRRIDISNAQKNSEDASYLLTPDEGLALKEMYSPGNTLDRPFQKPDMHFEVANISTITAITNSRSSENSLAVLNFASARNPGGGFLNGSMAQEEALAYSSGLYNIQIRHMEYYKKNRAYDLMTYTDHAIYSPDVVFFRDADFRLLEEPVLASVLTLPAVNMAQVRAKGENIDFSMQVMENRMCLALSILASEKNKTIILGAYGCGVFGNNPNNVARWWKELLIDVGYSSYFDTVLFAVLDKPYGENITAFKRVFEGAT